MNNFKNQKIWELLRAYALAFCEDTPYWRAASYGERYKYLSRIENEIERRINKSNSLTFNELAKANDERAKQWNPSGNNIPLIFNLVGGTTDLENLKDEIADVVICASLVARKAGFDLGEAVAKKFNATSRKHGFDVFLPEEAITPKPPIPEPPPLPPMELNKGW